MRPQEKLRRPGVISLELSRELAKYVTETSYDRLPSEVVSFTKLCILDYFGSAIAGSDKPPVKIMDEMVHELGGEAQATLITGGKSSVANAALVNGAASHVMELDDIHKASIIHAATVIIPAALAVSEWKKLSGKEFITAVVIGYEVAYRIGEAVSPSHYYYWHNTATCGTFGSTAAAGKLLGLSEDELVHAFGSAGTQAAGLWEFIEEGAMSKQLHPGKAAMNGVLSALLAQKGLTGAQKILEGNRGFFQAMSEDPNPNKIVEGLGQTFKIMENSFKVHASCRHTHPAMDLLIDLSNEEGVSPPSISSVKVRPYQVALDITDNDQPNSVYASKFSLQFCSALALVKGKGSLEDFTEETLWDQDIRSFMKKIEVQLDSDVDAAYPKEWGTQVEVGLITGETLIRKTNFPKGDPENPVNAEELMQKFMILSKQLPLDDRELLCERIMNLEKQDDMSDFFPTQWEKSLLGSKVR